MLTSSINPRPFGSDERANTEFFAGRAQGFAEAEAFTTTATRSEIEEALGEVAAFLEEAESASPWLAGWEGGRWEVLEDAIAELDGRPICWTH